MLEDDNQRISEIVRDLRTAHEQGVPTDEVFGLIKSSTAPTSTGVRCKTSRC